MRTIIAGTRAGVTQADVDAAMAASGFTPTVVLSGMAPGADAYGQAWAKAHGIPVEEHPAAWDDLTAPGGIIVSRPDGTRYNRLAGFYRNKVMARAAEALVLVWDGLSGGSRHMMAEAERRGLRIHVHKVAPLPDAVRKAERGRRR